eukprot:TRINITY_DN93219_c0_g1_i1.p1 TRINITY_DN93219_c0_g1~~TRINITY_DN93219_c0_g1_i1.p1  ORF type:complete len:598 (+),score=104.53 TRINITY_DN93219_c0_g1_i1:241-1794(+)
MQTLGGIVTFAVVFRTNQGWQRYWEGVTNLHLMYSKWADSYSQFCGFVSVTLHKLRSSDPESKIVDVQCKIETLLDMQEKVENDFLLLSAMACDRLCRGDCATMERREEEGVPWKDRIVLREDLRKAQDVSGSKGMPTFVKASQKQMPSRKSVREISLNMSGYWNAEYLIKKIPAPVKVDMLSESFDRPNMVLNWLNHNLAMASDMLMVPTPIQSRMFQELSNGMLGFNHALKVADVPFPFPYSQIILLVLTTWLCLLPWFVTSFTQSLIVGPLLSFMLSTFTFCMNDLARELENPFGTDTNDVCLPEFHNRFMLVVADASHSAANPPKPPKSKTRLELAEMKQVENAELKEVTQHEPFMFDEHTVELECPKEEKLNADSALSSEDGQVMRRAAHPVVTSASAVSSTSALSSASALSSFSQQLTLDFESEMQGILTEFAKMFGRMESHSRQRAERLQQLSHQAKLSSNEQRREFRSDAAGDSSDDSEVSKPRRCEVEASKSLFQQEPNDAWRVVVKV